MLQQPVEYPPLAVSDEEVDEMLCDLHLIAEQTGTRPGLYFGCIAVVVKSEEDIESLQARVRQEIFVHRKRGIKDPCLKKVSPTTSWIKDRRTNSSLYDGIERRRTA